jgi:hypothetical protein
MFFFKLYFSKLLGRTNNQLLFNISLIILFLIFLVIRFSIVLSYSSDIVVGEDNNVWNIQKMLSGKPLYTNPEDFPFEIFQYAPLSQYFTYFTAKLLSFKIGENVHGIFMIGRIYSLLFNLLTSFVIYRFNFIFFQTNKNVNLFLSFISLIIITYIDFTLRADSLSNLFIIISLFFFIKTLESNQFKYLFFTVLFSFIAIFAKQSAFQIIVYYFIIYFFLLPKKNIILLFLFIFFSIIFCSFFYLIYGRLFFYSTIIGISNPTDLKLAITILFEYTKRYGILILLSLLTFFLKNDDLRTSRHIKILFFIYVSSFIFSFGTSQKIGAGLNYYTMNIYISIILSSIILDRMLKKQFFQYKYLFLTILLIITSIHIFSERMYNRHLPQISLNHKEQYLIDAYFVKEVKKRIGIAKNESYIFTSNKNIKNLYFYNTVLPNTEYYSDDGSYFKWSNFDKSKLKYIIINENDSYNLNNRTLQQFKINIKEYELLYKYKNRKLFYKKQS